MVRQITDYVLYRWRYAIGIGVLIVGVTAMLVFAALYVPDGLRQAERDVALTSSALSFKDPDPASVINLPYYLLQTASIAILGVSILSIKLPSVILGTAAVIGMYFLLREWFTQRIAIITTLIATTTPVFLFVSQDGTPLIYAITTAIWLLLTSTFVSRRQAPALLWKLLAFALLALNLYAPLGVYLNLAILTTMIFHPHIRYVVRRLKPSRVATAVVAALLLSAPLIYAAFLQPSVLMDLAGIPSTMPPLLDNARELVRSYVGFHSAGESPIVQPIFSIGTFLVMLIGSYRFLQIKYTARSYITWFWLVTLVPFIVINPQYAAYAFVLSIIMIATGMMSLIRDWYKLFPRNPYARIVGLLPLSLVVLGLAFSGVARYGTAYFYGPTIVRHFDNDVRLVREQAARLEASAERPLLLTVHNDQRQFYELLAAHDDRLKLTNKINEPGSYQLVSGAIDQREARTVQPRQLSRIVTNRYNTDSDRFYLYTDNAS
ncbi:hypothetical protein CR983_03980 [Candidatus Saccharibacteria bacterium]|nr:MAG: hypothetical protein CR983_03980 [Candidatus Saccharibacteria bacterium]